METGETSAKTIERQSRHGVRPRLTQSATVAVIFLTVILGGCAGFVSGVKTATQAAFQLNPSSVTFGKVGVGKQTTQTIAVTNTGNTDVSITQVNFSNPQFSLPGAVFPVVLATRQSSNMTIAVTPTATGAVTGTLTAQGSNGSSPVTVNLSATAVNPAPQIALNTASVQFGTVTVGSTGKSSMTISNAGTADLTVSLISLAGAEFGISGIATPKTIAAGTSATATLTFQPTLAGAASGILTITSNDPATPTATVSLNGTGSTAATAQLQASPNSLSFGNVVVGGSSSQIITITNTGTAGIMIGAITVTGAGISGSGVTTPLFLNPSATATVDLTFAPTTPGSITGNLTVSSNASGSPLTIPVSGTGTQAGLTISPGSGAFGSVVDGQIKTQSFTLTNTGSGPLTISQFAVSGAAYSINGLATPATVAAGGSATFNAVFAPTTAGTLNGTVTVTSNAPNSPANIGLSGTGVAATIALSANPTSLTFGNVSTGSSSSKSVTLTNSGTSNVTISQVTVNAVDTTTSGITLPVTLTPGQTQSMTVTFSPKKEETVSSDITVSTTQGSSAVVAMSGAGTQANLNLIPTSANLGNAAVNSSSSQTILVSNTGNAVLTITQANVSGAGFSTSGLTLPLSINPGLSSTFNVVFQPAAAGPVSGSLSLISNAPTSPTAVSLSGTGVAATELLSFSTTNLNFGNVNVGSSSTNSVTITNTGNSNVQISSITESGTGYSLSGASTPVTVSPSQSTTFSVIFSPATTGSLPGSVTVTSNATGSPATITLSGSGVQATTHSVALSWTASASSGVAGYNVYRSTTSGTGYSKINGSLVTPVSYTDSTVASSATYYYVTTAVDGSGNESAFSNEAAAAIP